MKRTLVILALVFLAASTVNLVAAVLLVQPYTAMWPRPSINVFGTEAAAHSWPARPPHPNPWPPLYQWVRFETLGRVQIQATHAQNGQSTHQMQVYFYGWPFPVIRQTMLWWPDQDPAWKLNAPHDRGLELCAAGLIINPLLVALAAWLVCIAPFAAARAMKRRMRLRRSQCPACGYPKGVSERCTECGLLLPVRPAAAGR